MSSRPAVMDWLELGLMMRIDILFPYAWISQAGQYSSTETHGRSPSRGAEGPGKRRETKVETKRRNRRALSGITNSLIVYQVNTEAVR